MNFMQCFWKLFKWTDLLSHRNFFYKLRTKIQVRRQSLSHSTSISPVAQKLICYVFFYRDCFLEISHLLSFVHYAFEYIIAISINHCLMDFL